MRPIDSISMFPQSGQLAGLGQRGDFLEGRPMAGAGAGAGRTEGLPPILEAAIGLLGSAGEGERSAQQQQMLELLVALFILMSILSGGQDQGEGELARLGGGVPGGAGERGERGDFIAIEQTTISLTSTTVVAAFGTGADAGESLDTVA